MKICILTRFFDFRNAGLGRVSLEVADRLEERGHSVYRISCSGDSLYSYFSYTFVGIQEQLSRLPKDLDVYHAITPMEAMWLPVNKSVVTFHDLFQITHPNRLGSGLGEKGWKHFVGTRYFRFAVNRATKCASITAVSDLTKSDLETYLHVAPEKVQIVLSGIRPDLDFKYPHKGTGRLGYLGQLDRRKRVDLLINAFRASPLESLVIAGTGPERNTLEELSQGDPRITFLGRVEDEYLAEFYNSIDLLVFPTWIEGYGLPIVEAMACKRPVVVLNDAVLPQSIRTRCISVDNLRSLFEKPDDLLREYLRVDIDSNYAFAKSHNWETTIDAYEGIYRNLMNEGR